MKDVYDLVNAYKKDTTWIAGQDFVPYAGPYFDEKEQIAAIECILDGWLVMGKKSMAFERTFPKQFGKTHGILTNSGSSSNLLMMSALTSKRFGWPKGTKVLMPIAGFPTTLNPTLQVGFEPVFVDIEIDSLNLDIDKVEQVLLRNKDIKIITFAHVLGNPPNMNRLMDLVHHYRLILLEDCCDALGSTYNDKPLGS